MYFAKTDRLHEMEKLMRGIPNFCPRGQEELVKSLETLYTKSVPAGVRDFIALRSGEVTEQSVAKPKKAKLPKDNLTDNHQESENIEFGK